MKPLKKATALLAVIGVMTASLCGFAAAEGAAEKTAKTLADGAAGWLTRQVRPDPDSLLTDEALDWSAFALARGGYGQADGYLALTDRIVANNFGVTEPTDTQEVLTLAAYARIAIAAGANGGDARQIGGHDLIAAIEAEAAQEPYTNALAYALIALHTKEYGDTGKTEDALVARLLAGQLSDGSFGYMIPAPTTPDDPYYYLDLDSTAAVLQALAPYAQRAEVKPAIDRAVACLRGAQNADGSFGSGDICATTAQVIVALCSLGIDPLGADYVRDGRTMLTVFSEKAGLDGGLMAMQYDAQWNPTHEAENALTTYQGLYALTAYLRFAQGKAALYDFSDVSAPVPDTTAQPVPDTTAQPVPSAPDATQTEPSSSVPTDSGSPQTGDALTAAAMTALTACLAVGLTRKRK